MVRKIAPMPPKRQLFKKPGKDLVKDLVYTSNNNNGDGNRTSDCGFTSNDDVDVVRNQTIYDLRNQSIVKIKDEKNRIDFDYTDLVKRKYFGLEKEDQATLSYVLSPKEISASIISKNEVTSNVNKIKSQSIDDDDNNKLGDESQSGDGMSSSKPSSNGSFAPETDQSSLLSLGVGIGIGRSNNDELFLEDLQGTPPLTLFSEGAPPLTICPSSGGSATQNNNDNINYQDTDQSADHMSPVLGMYMLSVENTPNTQQPVLYSAISSLENANCNSFTKLNKRFLAPSKEFCKPGGKVVQSALILPARTYQAPGQQPRMNASSSLLPAISSTDPQIEQNDEYATHRALNVYDSDTNSWKTLPTTTTSNKNEENKIDGDGGKRNNFSIPSCIPDEKPSRRECSNRHSNAIISNTTKTESKDRKTNQNQKNTKKVSYDVATVKNKTGKKSKKGGPIEMFRPSSDAYTPRIERKHIKYKAAEARAPVHHMSSHMGTLQRPNFRDALRRVAMIIHQHIIKIESRFEQQDGGHCRSNNGSKKKSATNDGLFHASMRDIFNEDCYRTPTYKCNMARIPMARSGMVYGLRKIQVMYTIPSETEIYDFAHQLFKSVQLSSECSIVCLIYVERLMEIAKVPLLACTWRPIFMCGLLLASKVWQDLSSWNIEFSSVYPQFSLESINKLELNFLRNVKWDLYISSSSYAKYYFALRSLVEKQDFRQRYNRLVGGVGNVAQAEALKVQERTERVKEKVLLQLSRSM